MAKTSRPEGKAGRQERRPSGERRVEIADAVIGLIGRKGVASLTLAAVAKEIGLTQGALFRHFASREEILEAVAERIEALVTEAMPPADAPPLERVEGLFRVVGLVGERKGVGRFIFSEQLNLALPPNASERIRGIVSRTARFVTDALAEGAAQGVIRSDIAPEVLAVTVIGTLQATAFLSLALKRAPPTAGTSKAALLRLLSPTGARKR